MNEAKSALVTVVTRNYLHFARALAESVREHHPTLPVFVCLVDRPEAPFDAAAEKERVFFADELSIPDWPRFAFQYTGFELSCALKPHVLEHLLNREGFERVLYLDADIQCYHPLTDLFRTLETGNITLTPHLTAPLPNDGCIPTDQGILAAGAYNGGFVGVRRSAPALKFLHWWQDKMRTACITDAASHLFVDQGWLDLVPGLFEGVCIERGSGCNVAYWNLPHRRLQWSADGKLYANDDPLMFFHFTGFNPDRPGELSVYQDRLSPADLPVVAELLASYAQRLDACRRAECTAWGYRYARLQNGVPIEPTWREAVRTRHPALEDLRDPFDTHAVPDLENHYQAAAAESDSSRLDWCIPLWRNGAARMSRIEKHPLAGRMLSLYKWMADRPFKGNGSE